MGRGRSSARGRAPNSRSASRLFVPMRRGRLLQGVSLNAALWSKLLLVPSAFILAPVLAFALSTTVRDPALEALGYGLAPVGLWLAGLVLALRYRHALIVRYWTTWLGVALLVAASLGIMSMFHPSEGVMQEASYGGEWGKYFGDRPVALGALKIAVLIFLAPLMLLPRRMAPGYKKAAMGTFHDLAASAGWLRTRASGTRRGPAMPAPSSSPKLSKNGGTVRGTPPVGPTEPPKPSVLPNPAHQAPVGVTAGGWRLPSLELLGREESRPVSQAILQQMAQHIEETLGEHKVEVAVQDIRTGPRVIRFGLVPGWVKKYRESRGGRSTDVGDPTMDMSRVKVQAILLREKDLALALRTSYLRMEAPVPGEALVGLEVPNPQPRRVVLRPVAESTGFQKIAAAGGLPIAVGEDTGGDPIVSDLTALPHLLIAGATGSGKSVCINAVVASLILSTPPDRLRMLMVDPKRVELTPFNGIPHLVAPVIVDTDEVLVVLKDITDHMLHRYKLMEEIGVRNIEGYNRKSDEPMPFLVIIIDELADLMMAAAYEVEQALVRLAQLGRATGIHLILATQRPSVNVVTGLLKANVPTRIAFAVASQVDSRVILDSVGAEKLLGKGDMLLLSPDSPRPRRVQGTFIHDREIEKLVEFWSGQSGPPLPEIPLGKDTPPTGHQRYTEDDDLLERARELSERYRHISASVLQRRLQIGYPKAMQLMELLETEGLVSPSTDHSAR